MDHLGLLPGAACFVGPDSWLRFLKIAVKDCKGFDKMERKEVMGIGNQHIRCEVAAS
ncbi:hypothetical protein D3C86_2093060 [compost metagenome]